MEEFTLGRPDVFPPGTSVGVYLAESGVDTSKAPSQAALESAIVSFKEEKEEKVVLDETKTAITFKNLAAGRNYVAAGEVGGKWRYLRFVPGKMGSSLTPPARYPTHPAA